MRHHQYSANVCLQKIFLCYLSLEALIISTVGAKNMMDAILVDSIYEGFMTPSLPKRPGKSDYSRIKDTHKFLKVNATSIKRALEGVQTIYFKLFLPPAQYSRMSNTMFIRLTNPVRTFTVPYWA